MYSNLHVIHTCPQRLAFQSRWPRLMLHFSAIACESLYHTTPLSNRQLGLQKRVKEVGLDLYRGPSKGNTNERRDLGFWATTLVYLSISVSVRNCGCKNSPGECNRHSAFYFNINFNVHFNLLSTPDAIQSGYRTLADIRILGELIKTTNPRIVPQLVYLRQWGGSGVLELTWDNHEEEPRGLKPTHPTSAVDCLIQPQLPDIVHF